MASKKTTHRESKTQVENSAQKLKKEGRAHQKGKSSVGMNWKKEAGSPETQQLYWRYTYTSLRKEKLMSTTPKSSKI